MLLYSKKLFIWCNSYLIIKINFAISEHRVKNGMKDTVLLYFPDFKTVNTQLVLSFICKYFMIICTPACTTE